MKKYAGILVVVLLLMVATSAFARGGYGRRGGMGGGGCPMWGNGGGQGMMDGGWGPGGRGGMGYMGGGYGNVEMPQELKDKWVEAQKVRIDLQAEMTKNPIDRAKVEALRNKHRDLRQEISDWWFDQRMDSLQQPAEQPKK